MERQLAASQARCAELEEAERIASEAAAAAACARLKAAESVAAAAAIAFGTGSGSLDSGDVATGIDSRAMARALGAAVVATSSGTPPAVSTTALLESSSTTLAMTPKEGVNVVGAGEEKAGRKGGKGGVGQEDGDVDEGMVSADEVRSGESPVEIGRAIRAAAGGGGGGGGGPGGGDGGGVNDNNDSDEGLSRRRKIRRERARAVGAVVGRIGSQSADSLDSGGGVGLGAGGFGGSGSGSSRGRGLVGSGSFESNGGRTLGVGISGAADRGSGELQELEADGGGGGGGGGRKSAGRMRREAMAARLLEAEARERDMQEALEVGLLACSHAVRI